MVWCVLRFLLAPLVGLVMTDDAPGYGTGDGMVAGDMSGQAADHGTLDTARGEAQLG